MIIQIIRDTIKNGLLSGIKSCVYNPKNVKFFLSGILVVIAFISLNAKEAVESNIIYKSKNAVIVGKEHLFVKKDTRQTFVKNDSKIKRITTEPAENNIDKKHPSTILFSDFPFSPSFSSYLQYNKESALTVSQQKFDKLQPISKIYPIEKSNLSFLPEQKQKFFTVATQCGILTTFSPNSPPL